MDHRCGTRMPLNLEVALQSRTFGEVRGRIRDISIGGMRVEAGADFSVHQPVTIEFSFPHGSAPQRWEAMVVRAGNGSVGVMFEFLRAAELAKLIELLRAADAQARMPPLADRRRGPAAVAPAHGATHVAAAGRRGKP